MLMSLILPASIGAPGGGDIDRTTWVFDGHEWNKAQAPLAIPFAITGSGIVLVYDSTRHIEEMIIGAPLDSIGTTAPQSAGTWEWNGVAWVQHKTVHSLPFTTQYVSAAYSPELRATVMIDPESSQTWLYDGTDWRAKSTKHGPGGFAPQVAYDTIHHSIVALEGYYQTWRFDGNDWSSITPDGGPSPLLPIDISPMGRQAPAAAFDQKRGVWVVFGGSDGSSAPTDTWTGFGASWTKRMPTTSPPARWGWPGRPFMAWDPSNNRMLMFGGRTPGLSGLSLGDTWAWDGNTWTQLAGPTYPVAASTPSVPTTGSAARLSSPTFSP
jgi:hypothetical protein